MNAALGTRLLSYTLSFPVVDTSAGLFAAQKAMAAPGQAQFLPLAFAPQGLGAATFALCVALFNRRTPVWLSPRIDTPMLRASLGFYCQCPIVRQRSTARFALLDSAGLHDLADFNNASNGHPDQACTLLIQLNELHGGAESRWRGPGVKAPNPHGLGTVDVRRLSVPVANAFWRERSLRNRFPSGLDVFFCAGQQIIALPRSVSVLPAGAMH